MKLLTKFICVAYCVNNFHINANILFSLWHQPAPFHHSQHQQELIAYHPACMIDGLDSETYYSNNDDESNAHEVEKNDENTPQPETHEAEDEKATAAPRTKKPRSKKRLITKKPSGQDDEDANEPQISDKTPKPKPKRARATKRTTTKEPSSDDTEDTYKSGSVETTPKPKLKRTRSTRRTTKTTKEPSYEYDKSYDSYSYDEETTPKPKSKRTRSTRRTTKTTKEPSYEYDKSYDSYSYDEETTPKPKSKRTRKPIEEESIKNDYELTLKKRLKRGGARTTPPPPYSSDESDEQYSETSEEQKTTKPKMKKIRLRRSTDYPTTINLIAHPSRLRKVMYNESVERMIDYFTYVYEKKYNVFYQWFYRMIHDSRRNELRRYAELSSPSTRDYRLQRIHSSFPIPELHERMYYLIKDMDEFADYHSLTPKPHWNTSQPIPK